MLRGVTHAARFAARNATPALWPRFVNHKTSSYVGRELLARGFSGVGADPDDAAAMVGLAGIPVLPHRLTAHDSVTLDVDTITGDYAKNRLCVCVISAPNRAIKLPNTHSLQKFIIIMRLLYGFRSRCVPVQRVGLRDSAREFAARVQAGGQDLLLAYRAPRLRALHPRRRAPGVRRPAAACFASWLRVHDLKITRRDDGCHPAMVVVTLRPRAFMLSFTW